MRTCRFVQPPFGGETRPSPKRPLFLSGSLQEPRRADQDQPPHLGIFEGSFQRVAGSHGMSQNVDPVSVNQGVGNKIIDALPDIAFDIPYARIVDLFRIFRIAKSTLIRREDNPTFVREPVGQVLDQPILPSPGGTPVKKQDGGCVVRSLRYSEIRYDLHIVPACRWNGHGLPRWNVEYADFVPVGKRLNFPFQKQNLPRGLEHRRPEPDRIDEVITSQGDDQKSGNKEAAV